MILLCEFSQVHGKSKMKKAFCEPGNVGFCPPIDVASTFGFGLDPDSGNIVTIQRSEENGGNVEFRNREEMEAAFANGSLHPGDLKGKVSTIIVEVLDKLVQGIKADGDTTKASKALKALHKKLSKAKGGKK